MHQSDDDQQVTCSDCSSTFVFTAPEARFYESKGLQTPPKRCKQCRQARKANAPPGGGGGGGGDRRPRYSNDGPPRDSRPRESFGNAPRAFGNAPRTFDNGPPRGRPMNNGYAPRPSYGDARPSYDRPPARPSNDGPPRESRGFDQRPRFRSESQGNAPPPAPRGDNRNAGFRGPEGYGGQRGHEAPRPPRPYPPQYADRAPAPRSFDDRRPPPPQRSFDDRPRAPRAYGQQDDRPRTFDRGARDNRGDAGARAPSDGGGGARVRRERPRFDITCQACGASATVPFEPIPGRDLFCPTCYRARKPAPQGMHDSPPPRDDGDVD